MGNNVQLPARADVDKCWGYMGAVQDFSVMVDYETGKTLFRSCPGPDTTLTQLIRVFTNYARTHPQELHEKASLLVYRAMLGAFAPTEAADFGPALVDPRGAPPIQIGETFLSSSRLLRRPRFWHP